MPIEPIQPETEDVVDAVEDTQDAAADAGEAAVERQTKGFVMNHNVSLSTR